MAERQSCDWCDDYPADYQPPPEHMMLDANHHLCCRFCRQPFPETAQ